jgi:hypothetical protein
MNKAIEIVKECLSNVRGNSQWADGARTVLGDLLAQLESAQPGGQADRKPPGKVNMANNWNLATKIYDALKDKGADLGSASIYIIEKVLNDHESAQPSVEPTGGKLCENCGEPLESHVGGAKRGLCKNGEWNNWGRDT